jgi:hypothetical protein
MYVHKQAIIVAAIIITIAFQLLILNLTGILR